MSTKNTNTVQGSSPLTRDARELHRAVSHLIRVYQSMSREQSCCYDLSVSQCWALEAITDHGPFTMNQLAARLLLDTSTASRVVDALERKGYVDRRRDPEEGRTLQLAPTRAGQKLRERIETDVLTREAGILEGLDPEVRHSVVQVIDELARVACPGIPSSDGSCCSR